jgi:3-phenylpropionate/trans-cinnamate dioxygenase ferredoxin subunit
MSDFITVAELDDLPEGKPQSVAAEDQELVLIRQDGEVFALEDRCSHEEFPLHNGEVVDGQIECALHGARFDLESGDAKALPAVKPVKRFECRVEGGEVQVKL